MLKSHQLIEEHSCVKHYLSALIFCLAAIQATSQSLFIINKTTREPISDVYVYHEKVNKSGITREDGKMELMGFPKSGKYIFQHPGFQLRSMSYEEIREAEYTVVLKERILEFDEVVVSANRWEQDVNDVSQEILSIKAKTIAFQNPATSADLLAESGQVFVQKSQLGGGSPMLRGFSANSVLLVLDGVRLNNAIYRSGNLQNVINIDPNALEGAEVIYGPGSVMYGSDAMGGVMDFHTIEPGFTQLNQLKVSGNYMTRYATAANEKTGHIDLSISDKKWSYFGAFTYSSFDNLRAGSNRSKGYEGHFQRNFYAKRVNDQDILVRNENPDVQKFSGFDLYSLTQKLSVKTGDFSEIEYGFYHSSTTDIPRYDRLTLKEDGDSLTYAKWYYGPQKWTMNRISFNHFKPNQIYNQAKITVAHQRYQESRNDREFGSSFLRSRSEEVDLVTVTIDLDKEFNSSSLYYGVDFLFNDVKSDAYRRNIITREQTETTTRYPNQGSQYYTTAAYANYVFKPSSKWTFNTGARFSSVQLNAQTNDETAAGLLQDNIDLNNRALNGMVGMIYKPSQTTKLNFLASSGFRAPNVDDVGKVFEIDDETVVVPNPDLKPEFSYNQELGWKQKINLVEIDLVGFHSLLTDAIVRGPTTINGNNTIEINGEAKELRAQVNASRARIYGSSFRLSSQFDPTWATSATITYTKGYQIENQEPLRHIPPIFGRASLIYKEKKVKIEGNVTFNLAKNREDIADSEIVDKAFLYTDDGTPAWATLNINTQYTFNAFFEAQIAIENILDTHYRPYSSGISAPGRNISFVLKGSF